MKHTVRCYVKPVKCRIAQGVGPNNPLALNVTLSATNHGFTKSDETSLAHMLCSQTLVFSFDASLKT